MNHPATSAVLAAATVLLCSCAATSVKTTWTAPDYTGGPVGSVAVLAVQERGMLRAGIENRFAKELKNAGKTATPTYELLSLGQIKENREAAVADLQKAGAKTVLIIRLVDKDSQERSFRAGREEYAPVVTGYSPGIGYGPYDWYGYYSLAYQDMGTVWSTQSKRFLLESSLFELGSGKRIWACLTDTTLVENADSLVELDRLASKVVGALQADQLIQ